MNNKTDVTFRADGSPYSSLFDDIYFDTDSGYQQSDTVFIQGNKILTRLLQYKDAIKTSRPKSRTFTIAETGFGTGLNLLLTLKTYQAAINQVSIDVLPTLDFISTEKYPLSLEQLKQSLVILPELGELTEQLLAQYPKDIDSVQTQPIRCTFLDGKVTLQLFIGDATTCFEQISTQQGLVDAWYLDGFSPAKNPDMWHDALYQQIARLSKPQATLSTFTVAGKVRRGLKNVGFRLEKQDADTQKQEVLTGFLQQHQLHRHGYKVRPAISKPQHVAIIGGGIAAACAAYSLTQKGVKVTLYCKDEKVAQGASSNAIGALYPLLHQQADEISLFYQRAFWHARAHYDELLDKGFDFEHQWCGLLEVSYKDTLSKRQQQFEQLSTWPKSLIHSVDAKTANKIANIPLNMGGLFMPEAGWISPPTLVKATFDAAKTTGRLRIQNRTHIKELVQQDNNKWRLIADDEEFNESIVIFCGGAEGIKLNTIDTLPLSSVRGQVSNVNTSAATKGLATVICHKGYLTPENKGIHCIGATFTKNSNDTLASKEDDEFNLNMLHRCLPKLTSWSLDDVRASKARLRCMTPDHLPMVGAMPNIQKHIEMYGHLTKDKNWKYSEVAPVIDNLYVFTGLGARGLVSAPLLADILTADICSTPYPVDDEQLFNLSPNRFVIRDLIKRKVGM
ncbi:bifunctional tRNA (5-methylaminomethyl-2-thiouridine)(34)-methyltransferase MnmD/FAD-dependent 5-carboxymethylaminomethyl-2-thiouridine(34) oxidoreductase MnmC [Thalassotalea atypica]|uniref:bifunctional tRNA (5-methylaminomethyl-2-thiouridine)(34)-methyltransferase MnmD/FAD-dependent 5-carboxymethylaminomethyl-2-thiouridine(34) oxidoreductase MnmC n=1 Tax=Thalassotalea atypica TaxID=2054316 RepID=UPI002572AAAE|nr:bifunctional tRNA (5-methylaminomethyl-2-thiouridine)(34)-methyltransferase MnmD/FAD-dependent 5-carboxymethylaminomethyl-2-thiouridine(34) oxidoreductase MnmC [Thalassotalea atypica]